MADSALTDAERRFLQELELRGVAYMLVGLSAASLQGANTTTLDIDLWFERTSDPRIAEAARAVGGDWISGAELTVLLSGQDAFVSQRVDIFFRPIARYIDVSCCQSGNVRRASKAEGK